MKCLRLICLGIMVAFLFCYTADAREDFPLKIAVEFTDHAASAYIAQHKGWFEEEGIKPTFFSYVTGMSLASALGRGDIQAAYICLLPVINAIANAKVPARIVAGTHKHGYGLAVNGYKIKTIKDLERPDVRIGAVQVGGPVDATLLKTIEKYGLDRNKIIGKVQRMSPPLQIIAFKAGKLDASFVPLHWPAMAEDAGFKILLCSQDVWPSMQGSVLIVKETLIQNNPEIVRKLVRITEKATAWIRQHRDEAASVMAAQLRVTGDKIFPIEAAQAAAKLDITPAMVRRSMDRLEYTTAIDPKTVQDAIDFAVRQGYVRTPLSAGDILELRCLNEK